MKKYQVAAYAPQGTFFGKPFAEESLEENLDLLRNINTYSFLKLEDSNGGCVFFSKDMIGRTVFSIQPILYSAPTDEPYIRQ